MIRQSRLLTVSLAVAAIAFNNFCYGADSFFELQRTLSTLNSAEHTEVVKRVAALQLVDCRDTPPLELEKYSKRTMTQYIFNSSYQWSQIDTKDGECVYLQFPINRGLTRAEGQDLLVASQTDFPVRTFDDENGVRPKPMSGQGKNAVVNTPTSTNDDKH